MTNIIKFIQVSSPEPVVDFLTEQISSHLAKGQVLWLVPGGSAIKIAAAVTKKLDYNDKLANLTVTLTDERFGPLGHQDSNWPQLIEAGFSLPGAKLKPVLTGQDFEGTAQAYAKFLNQAITDSSYSLALAGMGPDGHIFGVKPNSSSVKTDQDVVAYDWDDYRRITPTINLIKRLDQIVVYAIGEEKWPQIDMLDKDLPASEQPAQLLKRCRQVTFFNDRKGPKYENSL